MRLLWDRIPLLDFLVLLGTWVAPTCLRIIRAFQKETLHFYFHSGKRIKMMAWPESGNYTCSHLFSQLILSSDGLKSCCGLESSKSFWWILDIVEFFLVCAAKPDFKKLFLSWPLGRHAHQKVTRFPGKFRLYVTFGLWCVTVTVCQKWKKVQQIKMPVGILV